MARCYCGCGHEVMKQDEDWQWPGRFGRHERTTPVVFAPGHYRRYLDTRPLEDHDVQMHREKDYDPRTRGVEKAGDRGWFHPDSPREKILERERQK